MSFLKLNYFSHALVWLLPLLSLTLLLYINWCSIGLTFDSYDYLFAAKSFRNTGILLNANETIFRERTPLFPILLAMLNNNVFYIKLSFALAHISILYGFLFFHRSFSTSSSEQLYLSVLLSFSVPLLLIESFIWSESYFLVLLSLSLYCLILWTTHQQITYIILAATLGFLYCIQRNTGIFFVLGSTLFIWSEKPTLKGLITAAFFSLTALSGWTLWTAYHLIEKGPGFQPTLLEIGENILPNILTYLDSYSVWIFPHTIALPIRVSLFSILLILGIRWLWETYQTQKNKLEGIVIKLWILMMSSYHLGMMLLEKAVIWEVDRFIAILYPFTAFIFVIIGSHQIKNKPLIIKILISLWLLYPMVRTYKNSIFLHHRNCHEKHF